MKYTGPGYSARWRSPDPGRIGVHHRMRRRQVRHNQCPFRRHFEARHRISLHHIDLRRYHRTQAHSFHSCNRHGPGIESRVGMLGNRSLHNLNLSPTHSGCHQNSRVRDMFHRDKSVTRIGLVVRKPIPSSSWDNSDRPGSSWLRRLVGLDPSQRHLCVPDRVGRSHWLPSIQRVCQKGRHNCARRQH